MESETNTALVHKAETFFIQLLVCVIMIVISIVLLLRCYKILKKMRR